MALPELTLPPGTPAFSAEGHNIELVPMYADVPMVTGHDRRRRVYTTVPRYVTVKMELTYPQMLAVHDWFEGPLQVGVQPFSAQVANQGPGLLWWKARFAEPYTADADEAGQLFVVTAKLLLEGEGSSTGPYSPNMAASVGVALSGSVVIVMPVSLAANATIALATVEPLQAGVIIALSYVQNGATPSSAQFDQRWTWQFLNYAASHSSELSDVTLSHQRSWMGY